MTLRSRVREKLKVKRNPLVAGLWTPGLRPLPQLEGLSLKSLFGFSESQWTPPLVVFMMGNMYESPTRPQGSLFLDLLTLLCCPDTKTQAHEQAAERGILTQAIQNGIHSLW